MGYLEYDSWIVIVKDVKYKVNKYIFCGLVFSGLISRETLVYYGFLKDDHGRLIFQPLSRIDFLFGSYILMLAYSEN